MSQFIVNLALLIFTLGIIVTGIQILLLSENKKIIQQKTTQFIKLYQDFFNRSQPLFRSFTFPLNSLFKKTFLQPPTKEEKEIAAEFKEALLPSTTLAKKTIKEFLNLTKLAFKLTRKALRVLFMMAFLLGCIFLLINVYKNKITLDTLLNFPENFREGIEELANKITTPLLAPLFKKYLE